MRYIYWDDVELPFANSPSRHAPDAHILRMDLRAGTPWMWNYRGLEGVLTLDVMRNALEIYDSHQSMRHQREPVPQVVGKFRWDQTITIDEYNGAKFAAAAADLVQALDLLNRLDQQGQQLFRDDATSSTHANNKP